MFPESFAETWIDRLTKRGQVVFDPFCGRGTTPFQALLMGRTAVAADVNDVAVCLTRAKTDAPPIGVIRRRLTMLEADFDARQWRGKADKCPEFFHAAYARRTLQKLLFLRQRLRWKTSRIDAFIAALVLGSLHGEADKSKSYFSNQMPRTISTKPAYSVRFWSERGLEAPERDVFSILRGRLAFRFETPPPVGDAITLHRDMRELPWIQETFPRPIKCVITSPPYFDVTSFEEDQWLRLWFLGGPPYPTNGRVSQDDRHRREEDYWSFIADMWRSLGKLTDSKAHVIIRIGSRRLAPDRLRDKLAATAALSGRGIRLVATETSNLRNRQTDAFRPGSKGCSVEVDCHFRFRN